MPARFADALPRLSQLSDGRLRGLKTVVAIGLVCLLVSALAGWHAMAGSPSGGVASGFGRANAFTLPPGDRDAYAAPAAGTTGTADLPDVPIPADYVARGDGTVIPARPFSTTLASPLDRGRALACLSAAIYYEAASESDDGQRAVAQVILNRVRHPAFPASVCGVVYQGSERHGCQFSFACDGATARIPSKSGWARAARIAETALSGYVYAPVGLATHYHTYAVTPAWNRKLVMTAAVGAHFFHRWQGFWGTPAAFSQVYRGGEPLPAPHPQDIELPPMIARAAAALASVQTPAAPAISATTAPAVGSTEIQPAFASSGSPIAPAGPPESQILDKWRDSGKPLR